MDLIEKATVMHYHRYRIGRYRHGTVESLGWRNAESQQIRYAVLARVGNLNGASILDVGCGYGDLKAYLDLHYTDYDYIGIDQQPEFIAEAKARYNGFLCTAFYQTDFSTARLPHVDYVFASGVLNYRCNKEQFYADMICKLYHSARVALAFNMLDKNHFPRHKLLIGHDCDSILTFCHTLSSQVECISDYLEDDFTVFMYRNAVVGHQQ
ncbi:class I SAM-dependent methyltransferase [Nitrosomonas aestuarii]|uniref:class I SAM-dependent methyltransferase n=1 Tax=Nitrosomonas aestuarii TaxID=52441 RepID=UPI000D31FB8E|nr:class I SAM-dependent methyltransferase [Nitrosomonas aestuarii]PTN11640.1 methyltransferase family protein [Nitrosomonas aestuarii]